MNKIIQIRNWLFYVFFALFFLFQRAQPPLFLLIILLSIFTKDIVFPKRIFKNTLSILYILFALIYGASFFYSSDLTQAISGLELKSSFILFTVFFPVFLSIASINKTYIINTLYMSSAASFLMLISRGIYRYFERNSIDVFFSSELSFLIHPTYLAVLLNLLLCYILFAISIKQLKKPYLLLAFLYVLYILLLSSKIGLILLVVNLFFAIIYYSISRKKYLALFIGSSLLASIAIGSYLFIPEINYKFNYAIQETFYTDYNDTSIDLSSTGQRIVAWKATSIIIKNNPVFGVGVGDIKNELKKSYDSLQYNHMKTTLDSHQQYLQTYATVGLIGLFVLLSFFVYFFYMGFITKNILLLLFGLNMFLFGLTESMLETQAGVLTFICFSIFFLQYPLKASNNETPMMGNNY